MLPSSNKGRCAHLESERFFTPSLASAGVRRCVWGARMSSNYRIIVLGEHGAELPKSVEASLMAVARQFGLSSGDEIEIVSEDNADDRPVSSVGIFIGAKPAPPLRYNWILRVGTPIIPIVSKIKNASAELPREILHLNAMPLDQATSSDAVAAAAMECLGLLPKQRRVFLSYVRNDCTPMALQLFAELSHRQFQVFVDTHDIRPGSQFQATLWHRLCDSDVMIMLDSDQYFERRWTREEYGRASVKKAAILRVGMPGVAADAALKVTDDVQLVAADITSTRRMRAKTLDRVCDRIELLRSQSIATRHANLIGSIATALGEMTGTLRAAGSMRSVEATLPRGKEILLYTAIGVPTAHVLNEIADHARSREAAIVYDELGIHKQWTSHKDWLAQHVPEVRWMPAHEIGWSLRGWDAE